MSTPKQVLVLSCSDPVREPRLRRQLGWLESKGVKVWLFAYGDDTSRLNREHLQLKPPTLAIRLFSYLQPSLKLRNLIFTKTRRHKQVLKLLQSGQIDAVVVNNVDFGAWEEFWTIVETVESRVILDLHEYFPDLGGGPIWKLLHDRYFRWLYRQQASRSVDSIITVSDEIANLYSEDFSREVKVLPNLPTEAVGKFPYKGSTSHALHGVYHGLAGANRGTYQIIKALRHTEPHIRVSLILVCGRITRFLHTTLAYTCGVRHRVSFPNPVPVDQIVQNIKDYDFGIAYFPPPQSRSIAYALPNKFFEYVLAGLPVVVGSTKTLDELVREYALGVRCVFWGSEYLASSMNRVPEVPVHNLEEGRSRLLEKYSQLKSEALFHEVIQIRDETS